MADNGWLARAKKLGASLVTLSENSVTQDGVTGDLARAEGQFGYDYVSQSILLGSGKRQARTRTQIYQKYHYMMGDPIISTALRAHVSMALGGDECTGDTVFLDTLPDAEKDAKRKALVDEIAGDVLPIFNRIAHAVAFNAVGFGDAYGRVYTREGEGLLTVCTDETVHPPLVQPYAKGDRCIGYVITTGQKFTEKMSLKQIARAKMPRMLYNPQSRVIEKALRANLVEDDIDNLPALPELVGGSFLEAAEEAYDNLSATLVGLVGQRILSSIDEAMIGVNLEGMTKAQRTAFMASITKMLTASKKYAQEAVERGQPATEKRYHLIPTFSEKQLTSVVPFQGQSGATNISVEDVLFHAKLLAGALGIDLSMLGFSELLSGGLGEGGFNRTSIQAAERSRIIRTCMTEFFYELIDLHTLAKYGWIFEPKDRPFKLSFYGSISALESEKQASRERATNSAALTLQALDQIKNLGMDAKTNQQFMEKMMDMDEDLAKMISDSLEAAKAAGGEENDQTGFGR